MKTHRHILLLAVAAMALACSKEEVIPDIPGVMSATAQMVAGDFDRTQYYCYKVKINRDPNVVGDNVITIEKENAVGRGLYHVNGELYLNPVSSQSNEFCIEYQPLTNDDKLNPFAFDVTVTAGNTRPVKLRISLDKPLILEKRIMYLGLDQTKFITAGDGLSSAAFTSTNNSIVTVNAKGQIKGIKPGKTTIGVERNGVVATCAVQVVNYRPVNDFVLNINGKDYHAATDTLFVKRGETLKVKMGKLLPEDGNWLLQSFVTDDITDDEIVDEWSGGYIRYFRAEFIPWKDFRTNETYTFRANGDLGNNSRILYVIKIFPELPEFYYSFTQEQDLIRKACGSSGLDDNSYHVELHVRLAK